MKPLRSVSNTVGKQPSIPFKGAFWAPLLLAAGACSNDEVAVSQLAQSFQGAMVEQEHVQIIYSDSGLAKIRVDAGLLEDYSEAEEWPRQVFRQGFRVSILNARGAETGYLKADKAVRRMSDQVWVLTGDVAGRPRRRQRLVHICDGMGPCETRISKRIRSPHSRQRRRSARKRLCGTRRFVAIHHLCSVRPL